MKRKLSVILLTAALISALTGCGRNPAANAAIDLGTSSVYTEDERTAAVRLILNEFRTWNGCELHSVSFAGDVECNEKNLAWLNELRAANDAEEPFTQCILFLSDFHSPKNDRNSGFNDDFEYTDWQWWLARSDGGKWKLITWGY